MVGKACILVLGVCMSRRQHRNPTIYDLSKLAGLSPGTVSAVLNGSWEKRRISEKTVSRVLELARQQGYAINMQARALRKDRSGIIGMIMPLYENRYFTTIAEVFEEKARERGLFPIVTCARRDPDLEERAASLMLAYQVDYIVCAGATAPDRIARLCEARGVGKINLDLPGSMAPSVISDNYGGAFKLTDLMLDRLEAMAPTARRDVLFIGGRSSDHNTRERVRAFTDAHARRSDDPGLRHISACGYSPRRAEETFAAYMEQAGALPRGMFVNSTTSMEGVLRWFYRNGIDRLNDISFCCFDWNPFAEMLGENFILLRQNVPEMMRILFDLIDRRVDTPDLLVEVEPELLRKQD
jgi:DNA-binding LacI/PurR family transcriptional regulator